MYSISFTAARPREEESFRAEKIGGFAESRQSSDERNNTKRDEKGRFYGGYGFSYPYYGYGGYGLRGYGGYGGFYG
ncbi:hypothetical protein QYM36_000529 [Artemia franciscana]|uniref:Uncharacterized protein n=1 Tax=Artemia franciscana TaxID=6661 RepID=A0AA88IF51_ARTSF|nr:hypothetical protein QYM36_000529 [Artemia franciscana]